MFTLIKNAIGYTCLFFTCAIVTLCLLDICVTNQLYKYERESYYNLVNNLQIDMYNAHYVGIGMRYFILRSNMIIVINEQIKIMPQIDIVHLLQNNMPLQLSNERFVCLHNIENFIINILLISIVCLLL